MTISGAYLGDCFSRVIGVRPLNKRQKFYKIGPRSDLLVANKNVSCNFSRQFDELPLLHPQLQTSMSSADVVLTVLKIYMSLFELSIVL